MWLDDKKKDVDIFMHDKNFDNRNVIEELLKSITELKEQKSKVFNAFLIYNTLYLKLPSAM